MLLYEVFYRDGTFDSAAPLPKRPPRGVDYAVCVNGERIKLVQKRGRWVAAK